MIPRKVSKRDLPNQRKKIRGDRRRPLPRPLHHPHHLRKAALSPAEADIARRNDRKKARNVADPAVPITGAPHPDPVVIQDRGLMIITAIARDQILVIVALVALVNRIMLVNSIISIIKATIGSKTMFRNKMNTSLMTAIIAHHTIEETTMVEAVVDTLVEEGIMAEEDVAATILILVRTMVHTDRKWVELKDDY